MELIKVEHTDANCSPSMEGDDRNVKNVFMVCSRLFNKTEGDALSSSIGSSSLASAEELLEPSPSIFTLVKSMGKEYIGYDWL